MIRHILALLLILCFGSPTASAKTWRAQSHLLPEKPFAHYLPLVQYPAPEPTPTPTPEPTPEPTPAIIEAVKTAQGEIEGYPAVYYAYGYARNLTSEPLYDVVIDMEVTIYPYDDPPPPPYTEIVHLTPALTATLPGQLNPFSYRMYLGKASASIGPIVNVSASPWSSGLEYYPLTIVGYAYEDGIVSGTARNEADHLLYHARIVSLEPYHCGWREAVLDTDTLLPGQVIRFTSSFGAYCQVDDSLIVSGQGAFQPWILP